MSPLPSPTSKHINSLNDIRDNYKTFLVDMVGVVYDGLTAYPGVIDRLNALISTHKVVILSNNPRPNHLALNSLKKMGVSGHYTVITSGDFTRYYLLNNHASDLVFHLGHQTNTDITAGLNINFTSHLARAECVLLTSFIEENQDPHQFDEILKQIVARNIPVLCANPDIYALYGAAIRKTAGFFAQRLLEFGLPPKQLKILGKPNRAFYDYAASQLPDIEDKKSVLMIGDTLETDVAGANNFGIDSLLTFTGITGLKINNSTSNFEKVQISPTYTITAL